MTDTARTDTARADTARTPAASALLVVDVQNANTHDGWQRDAVVGRIGSLIDRAKDEDVPVVWIQHVADGGMEEGSDGWQIVEEVRPSDGETVVSKRYFDAFADTTLRETLDRLGVGHLVVVGASSDACIRATSARAQSEGYDLTLVSDAHTAPEGPWEMPLPDGTTVPIGAREIIAYTNFFVADTEYPGVTTEVVPTAEVQFRSR